MRGSILRHLRAAARPRRLPLHISSALLSSALLAMGGCTTRLPPASERSAAPVLLEPLADPAPEAYAVVPPAGRSVRAERRFEPFVGATLGVSLPENQDLKAKRFDANKVLIDDLFSADVDTTNAPFLALHAGAWVTRGAVHDWGFEAQLLHWTTRAAADALAPKPGHASTGARPPFDSVEQTRGALFARVERRFFLREDSNGEGPFLFAGLGGGVVHTIVHHGAEDWAPGAEVFAGLAVPLSRRVRLRFDVQWITTHDADSKGTSESWRVDTSGRPSIPRSPHFDTRFVVPSLSLEFTF